MPGLGGNSSDNDAIITEDEFDKIMLEVFLMNSKHSNVVVRFKRGLDMQYLGKDMGNMCYYGEWSDSLQQPHGRGVWFEPTANFIRIGYSTYGEPSEGEVFNVETGDSGMHMREGKERFSDGDTIFEGKLHREGISPAGCWVNKWVNGVLVWNISDY